MFNVTDIFIPGKADLSGITGQKSDLAVSSAIHNAYVEVWRELVKNETHTKSKCK